ncbi:MAG: hypothetical protein ACREX0_16280 [Noviherbaspirillum sp.]
MKLSLRWNGKLVASRMRLKQCGDGTELALACAMAGDRHRRERIGWLGCR